jgi:exodeoxyribonuclease VII small subunit
LANFSKKLIEKVMANKFYSDDILSSYDKSYAELEKIEKELEGQIISVDRISELAQRCMPLIQTCKAKLKEVEGYVEEVFKETEKA